MQITIKTNKYIVPIIIDYKLIDRKLIKVNKELYNNMCKSGCKNYNVKHSCPPVSPNFLNMNKQLKYAFVIAYKLYTSVLGNDREFFKLTRAKAMLQGRVTKVIKNLEANIPDSYALINGSCHVCKKCSANYCIKPEQKRYSMEACGIDCNFLATSLFNYPLLWYKNKKCPEYVVGMALLLTNDNVLNLCRVFENDCGI